MQGKSRAGRPIKPTAIKGRNYRVAVRQRTDGTWAYQAQVYNAATRRRQTVGTYDTAEDAVAACQQALGLLSEGPSITVAAVQQRWLGHKRVQGHMLSSMRRAQENTDPFVAVYGREPMRTITRAIAQEWLDQHRSHYTDLAAMSNFAVEELEATPASPFKGKRPVSPTRSTPTWPGARSPSPSCWSWPSTRAGVTACGMRCWCCGWATGGSASPSCSTPTLTGSRA
jgi:hypothetical protein